MPRTDPYQPHGDIALFMPTEGAVTGYRRETDFATGVVTVGWTDGSTDFERSVFVSRADDVVVLRARGSEPGRVTCTVQLTQHGGGASQSGWFSGAPAEGVPVTFESWAEDGWLGLSGRYDNGDEFGAVGRVVAAGGSATTACEEVRVEGADDVIVLVKLFANEPADAAVPRLREELAALCPDFGLLLECHVDVHRGLFERMTLDLDAGNDRAKTNERLLHDAYGGDVPTALVERLFAYGRYLLVCSSAPGSWPANLQGVWNGDHNPAWSSDYHNDENIQMNYWQALPGRMPEVALPYFDYYERFLPHYRGNAKALFGCRGIWIPIAQAVHGDPYPGVWSNWTAAAGWLAQLFYDYWLFTGDRDFLAERAVPFLREVALFYEDFLFEGDDGRLVFSPSLSPENRAAVEGSALACVNATMDVAIAREVLTNLCSACAELGIEDDGIVRWQALLAKLPDYQVNKDGAIREWLWPGLADNYHHRHQSHIYPLFPGIEVTEESDPALFDACRAAVEKRLVIGLASQSGWSLAHMANIYARLGEGDRALACLEILARSCVGPNLFTYHNDWRGQGLTLGGGPDHHPPFQIDANFGLTAAVLEMLVFSMPGMVKLLPALPSGWPTGRATGIACRGGITTDIEWNMPAGSLRAVLCSRTDQRVEVKLPFAAGRVAADPAVELSESPLGSAYREIALPAGMRVALSVERA
jgi:alpha-L-fucosidase 2